MAVCSRAEAVGGDERADNGRPARNDPEHGTQEQINGNK